MTCGPTPEYGPVVVHRFDVGAVACRCGAMVVKQPEPKQQFNQQVYGKAGGKRGPRKKRKS